MPILKEGQEPGLQQLNIRIPGQPGHMPDLRFVHQETSVLPEVQSRLMSDLKLQLAPATIAVQSEVIVTTPVQVQISGVQAVRQDRLLHTAVPVRHTGLLAGRQEQSQEAALL